MFHLLWYSTEKRSSCQRSLSPTCSKGIILIVRYLTIPCEVAIICSPVSEFHPSHMTFVNGESAFATSCFPCDLNKTVSPYFCHAYCWLLVGPSLVLWRAVIVKKKSVEQPRCMFNHPRHESGVLPDIHDDQCEVAELLQVEVHRLDCIGFDDIFPLSLGSVNSVQSLFVLHSLWDPPSSLIVALKTVLIDDSSSDWRIDGVSSCLIYEYF